MAYKQQTFVSTILEAGKSRILALAEVVFGEGLLVHDCLLFIISSLGGRGKGSLWDLIYKGIGPTHEGSPFITS